MKIRNSILFLKMEIQSLQNLMYLKVVTKTLKIWQIRQVTQLR